VRGRHFYRAHGLLIASDIALPELPIAGATRDPDLSIVLDEQLALPEGNPPDEAFRPWGDGFLMRVPGAAHFHVRHGKEIRIRPLADADPGLLRLYLIGSALGMALHQRGLLVMHAAAVLQAGTVTLFVGDSGAGKSTLASRFARAGHAVLADDVVAIQFDAHGIPHAWPGSTSFKLWTESLQGLGLDSATLAQVANRAEKYYVENAEPAADAQHRLGRILVLEPAPATDGHVLQALPLLAATAAISANTYRPEYIGLLGRQASHLTQCVKVASSVPVLNLRYPRDLARLEETMDFIGG